ncbi:hypothetical protein [Hydrogenophaga sp. 2FB]|uniref:hypothetical protein n=1 Tax=Hydrogenophaga sp. 2FB TaxID=2502187 RepID=UPI0010F716F8|nr:hypothetical protein [Hydrogenophaga sp. 2FB]
MAKDFNHTTWHHDADFLKSLLRIKPTRRLTFARMAVHHHRLLTHCFSLAKLNDGFGPWGSLYGSDIEAVTARLMRVIELRIPYWSSETDTSHGIPSEIFRRRKHLKDFTRNWESLPKGVITDRFELVLRAYLSNLFFDLDDHEALRDTGEEACAPLEVLLSRGPLIPLAMHFIEFGADTQGIPKHRRMGPGNSHIEAGDFDRFVISKMGSDPNAHRRVLALQMKGAIARASSAPPVATPPGSHETDTPSTAATPRPPSQARPRRAGI